jgi:hypothetical protein
MSEQIKEGSKTALVSFKNSSYVLYILRKKNETVCIVNSTRYFSAFFTIIATQTGISWGIFPNDLPLSKDWALRK